MNDLMMLFNNEAFGEVRTLQEGDRVLFVARDIAKALGYAVNDHCRYTLKRGIPHPQNPEMGLYEILMLCTEFVKYLTGRKITQYKFKFGGYHV